MCACKQRVLEIVSEVKTTITSTNDPTTITTSLKSLHRWLPDIETSTCHEEQECFLQYHYIRFLYFLLENVDISWENQWTNEQLTIFEDFFVQGNLNDSLLVLVEAIADTSPSYKLDRYIDILDKLISPKCLSKAFIKESKVEKNLINVRDASWADFITVLISLPERMANKLQTNLRFSFCPEPYFTNLSAAIFITLNKIGDELRKGHDCNLQFLSRLFGRCCLIGQATPVLTCILKRLVKTEDFIWRRLCQKFLLGIPDRCLENMLSCLVKLLPESKWMSVALGDAVLTNNKLRMLLTQKFLLLRTFDDNKVIRNILDYVSASDADLLKTVFRSLLSVWGDKIAVKHTSLEQHTYITHCVLVAAGLLNPDKLTDVRADLVRKLMDGVYCHLESPHEDIRLLGMITAECLTQILDANTESLKFDYPKTFDPEKFKSLMRPEKIQENYDLSYLDAVTKKIEDINLDSNSTQEIDIKKVTENLDSDDDLEPYDMSNDTPVRKIKKPSYLRDCLEGLADQSNPDRTEMCLESVEYLIRNERDLSNILAVEVAQILLHMENNCSMSNFAQLRQKGLVATLVCSPIKVATYLTHQFYDRGYSIRQRLEILQVLHIAASELAQPIDETKKTLPLQKSSPVLSKVETAENWREVVQKRIDSKTRYFRKVKPKEVVEPVANRFAPVAGYFFFDLMKNFDHKENTLDLLGDDCFVLSRLLFTLGSILHSAINSPIVLQMAKNLLDFLWSLRFHTENSIRKGVLFCFSMILVTVPSHLIYQNLQFEFLEGVQWLNGVVLDDVDQECKELANQALYLSRNIVSEI